MLCHWSHIEKTLMDKKVQEYNLNINKQVIWFDFHDFFMKNFGKAWILNIK